jgi:hypothetical protein
VLPQIGIRSLSELAALEGEDLMHRIRSNTELDRSAYPNPVIGGVVRKAPK